MAKFRRPPNISFKRPRMTNPQGVGASVGASTEHIVGKPAYNSLRTNKQVTDVDSAYDKADELFINIAGIQTKLSQVIALAESFPKAAFIPVSITATDVRHAVTRRDRETSPDGSQIYFPLFKQVVDHALNRYKFVNFEFLDNLKGSPSDDTPLWNANKFLNDLGGSGDIERAAADIANNLAEDAELAAKLRASEDGDSKSRILSILIAALPIIYLWLDENLDGIFSSIKRGSATAGKQPSATEVAVIIIQILIGICIYMLVHALTSDEMKKLLKNAGYDDALRKAGANFNNPAFSVDNLVDMASNLVNGGTINIDGRDMGLADLPLGASKEFLDIAIAHVGSADWEILLNYCMDYLMLHASDDKYYPWHAYMDGKSGLNETDQMMKLAPHYSPVFRNHAKKNNVTIRVGGTILPEGMQNVGNSDIYTSTYQEDQDEPSFAQKVDKVWQDVKDDVRETSRDGFKMNEDGGGTEIDPLAWMPPVGESSVEYIRSQFQDAQDFVSNVNSEMAGYADYAGKWTKEAVTFDDATYKWAKWFADSWNYISDQLLSEFAWKDYYKEFLCCFLRYAVHCHPQVLLNMKNLLKWLQTSISYDYGKVLRKLYDKYWAGMMDQFKAELKGMLDEIWRKVIEVNIKPLAEKWTDNVWEYCFLWDMMINAIIDFMLKFRAQIDATLDDLFARLIVSSELFQGKIEYRLNLKSLDFFVKLLDLVIDLVDQCGTKLDEANIRQMEENLSQRMDNLFTSDVPVWTPAQANTSGDTPISSFNVAQAIRTSVGISENNLPSEENRVYNKIVAYGHDVAIPSKYDKATEYNSWWFAKPVEYNYGLILMPPSAILTRGYKDEQVAEAQQRRCRDSMTSESLWGLFSGLPMSMLNPEIVAMKLRGSQSV